MSPTKKDEPTPPMDPNSGATKTPSAPMSERTCYAAQTLIAEVKELFPETTYTVGHRNGRGVALSVDFVVPDGAEGMVDLLVLLATDERVSSVVPHWDGVEDCPMIQVMFRGKATTQDSRDSFRLGAAWEIMVDAADETEPSDPDPSAELAALAESPDRLGISGDWSHLEGSA